MYSCNFENAGEKGSERKSRSVCVCERERCEIKWLLCGESLYFRSNDQSIANFTENHHCHHHDNISNEYNNAWNGIHQAYPQCQIQLLKQSIFIFAFSLSALAFCFISFLLLFSSLFLCRLFSGYRFRFTPNAIAPN